MGHLEPVPLALLIDITFHVNKGQECLVVKQLDHLQGIIPKFT